MEFTVGNAIKLKREKVNYSINEKLGFIDGNDIDNFVYFGKIYKVTNSLISKFGNQVLRIDADWNHKTKWLENSLFELA